MADRGDLLPGEIKSRLGTRVFGRRLYYLAAVDSTNRVAVALAKEGEAHGTVVIADFQTGGKGRWNRRWESPRGRDLLFSIILRPQAAANMVLPLTLTLSVGVAEAIGRVTGKNAGVKWPNDVVVEGKKISGILSESSTQGSRTGFVVSGIGINVNAAPGDFAEEFRDRTCSCLTLTGTELDRAEVLARVLSSLETAYESFAGEGFGPMLERYKALLAIWRGNIRFERAGREIVGTVRDVAPDGGLVIDSGAGPLTLYEEEVFILRNEGSP